MRIFVVFLSSVRLLEQHIQIGHDRLLPSPYLLAIHDHSTLYGLLTATETSSLNRLRTNRVLLAACKCTPSTDCHFLQMYARGALWEPIMPKPVGLCVRVLHRPDYQTDFDCICCWASRPQRALYYMFHVRVLNDGFIWAYILTYIGPMCNIRNLIWLILNFIRKHNCGGPVLTELTFGL
jgi:hypothetical protein